MIMRKSTGATGVHCQNEAPSMQITTITATKTRSTVTLEGNISENQKMRIVMGVIGVDKMGYIGEAWGTKEEDDPPNINSIACSLIHRRYVFK